MRTSRAQDSDPARRSPARAVVRRAAATGAVLALLGAPVLLEHTTPPGAEPVSRADSAARGDDAPVTALLELDTPSSWQAWRSAEEGARRGRRSAEATRRAAAGAGQQQRRAVTAAADRTLSALRRAVPGVRVLYRTSAVLPGVAVRVPADRLAALRGLPGVRAVHPISNKYPANAHSVPLTGAPAVWAGADAVPGNTGKGVTIGIIDSGIDYTHADFGGPGTPEAYKAVDGSKPAPAGLFPNAKVVGGWDLVGDDYNTDPSEPPYQPEPHPDPNPLDCTANGHGTHVAGTAAGYGVTTDGRTYTGPYGPGLDPAAFRVGPGAAPGASLYALRVFGCHGSTDQIAQALDRAADPNQDGDFSDRLDVVNLSLGGSFGDPNDGDAVAVDRLASTGTVVVASAGNDGDVYGIGSSPAVAPGAVAVAASVDGHTDADGIRLLPPAAVDGTGSTGGTGGVGPGTGTGPGAGGSAPAPGGPVSGGGPAGGTPSPGTPGPGVPGPGSPAPGTPGTPGTPGPSSPAPGVPGPGSSGSPGGSAPGGSPGIPAAPGTGARRMADPPPGSGPGGAAARPAPGPSAPTPGPAAPAPGPAAPAPGPAAPTPGAQPAPTAGPPTTGSSAGPAAPGGVLPAHWSSKYTGWETKDVTGELALPAPDGHDVDGCQPFGPSDVARLRGRVAVLAWTVSDADRSCGSGARADHAADAGAIGVIFAADGNEVGEIAGDARIPAVIVAPAEGDRLREAAASVTPARVQLAAAGNTLRGSVSQDRPELADTLAPFSSRGNGLPGLVKPDITAPGVTILSAEAGSGSHGVRKDGTSMAAPHITGIAALVRAAHPAWSPTQVKAALMNTADVDLTTGERGSGSVYGPERVGAGRVRADLAVRTPVIAYAVGQDVAEGAVGVSFGDVPVAGPLSLTREVEVRNLGDRPLSYRTGYRSATEVPGAAYSVEPQQVQLPAGGTARVRVTLQVPNPSDLARRPDPTLDAQQSGHPRAYRAEASGRLMLTPDGDAGLPELRVPVFAAPHAVSRFVGALAARMPLDITGRSGLLIRIGGAPTPEDPEGLTDPASGPGSMVSAFVLGGQGPRWPDCDPAQQPGVQCAATPLDRLADLRLAGAASDAPAVAARGGDPLEDGTLYLAATTWAAAPTPVGKAAVRASLDTDGDGRTDAVVEAARLPGSDVLVARTRDATTGEVLDVEPLDARWGDTDTGLLDSDTVVLPVRLSALPGLRQSTAEMRYAVWTGPAGGGGVPDARSAFDSIGMVDGRPALPLDVLHPALDIRGGIGGPAAVAMPEQPGSVLEVRRAPWAYGIWSAGALLLVHHRNAVGQQAQVIPLPIW